MQYRAILRFSLDGDTGSAYRNPIAQRLKDLGFDNIGTGSWNCDHLDAADLESFANIVHDIMAVGTKTDGKTQLDHVWSYVDIPKPPVKV